MVLEEAHKELARRDILHEWPQDFDKPNTTRAGRGSPDPAQRPAVGGVRRPGLCTALAACTFLRATAHL